MSELSFDAPVWRHGKALRKGYTTGSWRRRRQKSPR